MKHTSIVVNNPVELLELTPVNPLISRCQIKVCYVGDTPNRNGSIITKEVAREMANTLPGSPIVGFYNEGTKDFEEHNRRIEISGGELKFEDTTRPYGFVDLNAKVWFQDFLDDGVVHTYLVTEGWLWTGQYPESKRIIEHGNNQSMELDPDSLDGSWTIDDKSGMEFFIINEAIFSKLCILGEEFEPCFEGATITHFSLNEEFNQKIYALMKEVKELKGGYSLMDKEDILVKEETMEEAAVIPEEEVYSLSEEASTEEENSVEESPEEEILENQDKVITFSLEDFQNLQNELDSLKSQYSDLETRYNELQVKYTEAEENYNSMKADFDVLTEFKERKDREEKQNMIDSFYMLSEEEKKDIQDNIDKYSVEEIESKLSVICVHNKLDLSDKKEEEKETETTFSLSGEQEEDFNAPAWLNLLRKTKNN